MNQWEECQYRNHRNNNLYLDEEDKEEEDYRSNNRYNKGAVIMVIDCVEYSWGI